MTLYVHEQERITTREIDGALALVCEQTYREATAAEVLAHPAVVALVAERDRLRALLAAEHGRIVSKIRDAAEKHFADFRWSREIEPHAEAVLDDLADALEAMEAATRAAKETT